MGMWMWRWVWVWVWVRSAAVRGCVNQLRHACGGGALTSPTSLDPARRGSSARSAIYGLTTASHPWPDLRAPGRVEALRRIDQDFFPLEGIEQRFAPSLSPQAKGRAGVGCCCSCFGGLTGKAPTPPHPSPALRAREGAQTEVL